MNRTLICYLSGIYVPAAQGTRTDTLEVTAVGMCAEAKGMKSLEGPSWTMISIVMWMFLVIFLSGYGLGMLCSKRKPMRKHTIQGSKESEDSSLPPKTSSQSHVPTETVVYVARSGQCYYVACCF